MYMKRLYLFPLRVFYGETYFQQASNSVPRIMCDENMLQKAEFPTENRNRHRHSIFLGKTTIR